MATPPPTAGTDGPPTPLRGIRVLVVDDNPDIRELIAAVLERAQAEVATAASAEEALDADGFELIHRVRAWERTGGAGVPIPAAAVSAYASLGRRLRHARDEFQAFLTKPVDEETLVRTVRDLAQRRSL